MMIINVVGLLLIMFIVWWFWLSEKSSKDTRANPSNDILIRVVDGQYMPNAITASKGQVITLRFLRSDPSPCSETVVFPELSISKELTLNKTIEIQLENLKPGTYHFHCQMNMLKGVLTVC